MLLYLQIYVCTSIYAHILFHVWILSCKYAYITTSDAYMHRCIHAYMHTCIDAYINIRPDIHNYIHR